MSTVEFGAQHDDKQQVQSNASLHQDLSLLRSLNSPNYTPTPSPSTVMAERPDLTGNVSQDPEKKQDKPRLTIRQLREAAQKETLAKELAKASQKSPENQSKAAGAPQKKKPSILGGLFQVREPTQIALNQVAAQMVAQHGSTSATKVPNVRLEKMPDFVPKVNSKWDGIPESVKQREKKEKEKEKQISRRESFFKADSRTSDDTGRRRRNSRNSSSTTGSSFGAFGNSSGSQTGSSRTRFYARSVNSSGDVASQQQTDPSLFSRSPTYPPAGESIPERPSQPRRAPSSADTEQHCGPRNDLDPNPPKPSHTNRSHAVRSRSIKSCGSEASWSLRSSATNRSLENQADATERALAWESIDWAQAARSYATHGAGAISQQPALLSAPRDQYSATSSEQESFGLRSGSNELSLHGVLSSGPDVQDVPIVRRKSQAEVADADAFLAGEARELVLLEDNSAHDKTMASATAQTSGTRTADGGRSRVQQDLEKRPDSSRERLGLRASMLLTDEITPWERAETAQLPPPSPRAEHQTPSTSKRFHKVFRQV